MTKTKTPKNNPVAALYQAAKEIVDGTRKVFEQQGHDAREVRLPILMHGTDMRVTIEAGPKIAARNAVEHAQMQASGKPAEPTVDVSAALQEAQMLLGLFAADLAAENRRHETGTGAWERSRAYGLRCEKAIQQLIEVGRLS